MLKKKDIEKLKRAYLACVGGTIEDMLTLSEDPIYDYHHKWNLMVDIFKALDSDVIMFVSDLAHYMDGDSIKNKIDVRFSLGEELENERRTVVKLLKSPIEDMPTFVDHKSFPWENYLRFSLKSELHNLNAPIRGSSVSFVAMLAFWRLEIQK